MNTREQVQDKLNIFVSLFFRVDLSLIYKICRLKSDASAKQLAQAASLLKAAAGLKILKPEISLDGNSLLGDGEFDEIAPGIQVSKNTHNGALKLLSKLYFSGMPSKYKILWETVSQQICHVVKLAYTFFNKIIFAIQTCIAGDHWKVDQVCQKAYLSITCKEGNMWQTESMCF